MCACVRVSVHGSCAKARVLCVELACVHPDGEKLVLCAQQQLQIYNVKSKEKIQACALPEAPVFTKWVDESTLGIVTGTAVFHWGLGGK